MCRGSGRAPRPARVAGRDAPVGGAHARPMKISVRQATGKTCRHCWPSTANSTRTMRRWPRLPRTRCGNRSRGSADAPSWGRGRQHACRHGGLPGHAEPDPRRPGHSVRGERRGGRHHPAARRRPPADGHCRPPRQGERLLRGPVAGSGRPVRPHLRDSALLARGSVPSPRTHRHRGVPAACVVLLDAAGVRGRLPATRRVAGPRAPAAAAPAPARQGPVAASRRRPADGPGARHRRRTGRPPRLRRGRLPVPAGGLVAARAARPGPQSEPRPCGGPAGRYPGARSVSPPR